MRLLGYIILALVISSCGRINTKEKISKVDFPKILNPKLDTIEVTYIAWACSCPNWLPDKYFNLENDKLSVKPEDYCIFIEADKKGLKIPDEYHYGKKTNRIRLIGKFYENKGISRDYEAPTSRKPKKAHVFRYSEVEVIKPYSIWDYKTKDENGNAIIKTIKNGMKAFNE